MDDTIRELVIDAEDEYEAINDIRTKVSDYSPGSNHPVDLVLWVDLDKVRANDYNPNEVADNEMRLLYYSIKNDGYTQPIVTVYDEEEEEYVIVDGFHRYRIVLENEDIQEALDGKIPITVIDKGINERMASTIRHNRARGKHNIKGQAELVFKMLDNGWSDKKICSELGMEAEELVRLKHVTGFSKLFDDVDYSYAWKTTKQISIEKEHGMQAP